MVILKSQRLFLSFPQENSICYRNSNSRNNKVEKHAFMNYFYRVMANQHEIPFIPVSDCFSLVL